MKSLQVLFGDTLDPVHYGHLESVEVLANLIGLARVTIIPNNIPPRRPQPETNSIQHKHTFELVIAGKSLFTLDERELKRSAPSCTAQTLKEWQQERGPDMPPASITDQDSLPTSPVWYEYKTILDNAHLIACRCLDYLLEMAQPQYQQWLEDRLMHDPEDLHPQPTGKTYLVKTPQFNILATIIYERLQSGEPCEDLSPEPVLTYTNQQSLYR